MKFFIKNFLNGVLTIVPIILSIYVVYKVFTLFDSLLGTFLKMYLKEAYVPGIGLLCTIVLITLLGWLSTQYISGRIIKLIDKLLESIPLIKTIYSIIKDTVSSFIGEKKSFSKVALVEIPNTGMKCIGFITAEELEKFHSALENHIAVYVPQTFQVAGITFLIPKEQIQILDISPEEAMKFILSGGITSKRE